MGTIPACLAGHSNASRYRRRPRRLLSRHLKKNAANAVSRRVVQPVANTGKPSLSSARPDPKLARILLLCDHRQPTTRGPLADADEDEDLEVIGSRHTSGGSAEGHVDDEEGGDWTQRLASLFPGDQRERVQQRLHGMAHKVRLTNLNLVRVRAETRVVRVHVERLPHFGSVDACSHPLVSP